MIKLITNSTALGEDFKSDLYELATINEAVDYCAEQEVLGVDTETEGFDFTCKQMIMFQIGDEHNQYVIDTRHVSIEPLRQILESKKIIKIFHNANDLITAATGEKERLIDRLRAYLGETSREKLLERRAAESKFIQDELANVPFPVYIG